MAKLMGIVNVTPDSFFDGSRVMDQCALSNRIEEMTAMGADVLDIGACSTRPGSQPVSTEEERERLAWALPIVIERNNGRCLISVDTFRPEIARWCISEFGVHIINDISGGGAEMYQVVRDTGAGYVITFGRDNAQLDVTADALAFFSSRIGTMKDLGIDVDGKVIADPGFGFGKTLDENWQLLSQMAVLKELGLPILAGLSRKSMAWKLLGITPGECLPATVAMNMAALERGAEWLRVHDVREGRQTLEIFNKLTQNKLQ